MPRRVCVKMTGRARRTNMMNMFADEKEEGVSGSQRQEHRPPGRRTQTFRQNRKDCYTKKRSGSETDQRAKRFVRELQRRANPSAHKRENVSRDDLPERIGHSRARASCRRGMIFAAVLRLDGNVNQFVVAAQQRSIRIATLWLVRDN